MSKQLDESFVLEYARVQSAIKAVDEALSGKNIELCFDREPKARYCIGVLSPISTKDASDADKKAWSLKRRPNSIGFDARLTKESSTIRLTISVNFAVYYRSVPTYSEQKRGFTTGQVENEEEDKTGKVRLRLKYKRVDVIVDPVEIEVAIPSTTRTPQDIDSEVITQAVNNKLTEIAEDIYNRSDCWYDESREPTIPSLALSSEESYEEHLPQLAKAKPSWKVKTSGKLYPAEEGHWRLVFSLANDSEAEIKNHPLELFSAQIACEIKNATFISLPFHAAIEDYRYKTVSWGRGINCVLDPLKVVDGHTTSIQTNTTPVFEQVRIESRNVTKDSCLFSRLQTDDLFTALEEIGKWLNEYADIWKESNKQFIGTETYETRQNDLAEYEKEIKRFYFGIDALKRDKKILTSFKLMNKVFSEMKKQGIIEHNQWRLFQIVYVVTQMPSLLAREIPEKEFLEELEQVDVLWFPTGGGKTEAYFGVIVTALYFDRLRGKSRGVTAWLRYPLRMLSIQQLQRLVDVVAWAEIVRTTEQNQELQVGDPFSIGYYVGAKNTPNRLTQPAQWGDPLAPIKKIKDETERLNNNDLPYLVLQRCPYCMSEKMRVEADIDALRVKHVCEDCHKTSPIYISDSEIYRYAPSIIVGTIDRLARAGETSEFSHIFGQFTHVCPDHGYLSFNKCIEDSVCKKKGSFIELKPLADPTPTLLLQDELHLLRESLGTYDAHYEGFLDVFAASIGNGLPSKRLGATATIEGYEDHVMHLYGRKAIRFPVKGMDLNDSAYTEKSEGNPISRVYIGILPTSTNTQEVVATIIKVLKQNSKKEYGEVAKWGEKIIDDYDLTLAYVNEKSTSGDIQSKLDDLDAIRVLTGDKGMGEVRSAISRILFDKNIDFHSRLKGVLATSIISHGVDLSRLNFMTFCGMPNHASDYIQASSRVGRNHIGVVFTVFRPDNNRERNMYHRFYEYHERLYQLVLPVPINRLSESSMKRTFTGILSSCLLNILAHKKNISFDRPDPFIKAMESVVISDEELFTMLREVYNIENSNLPGSILQYYDHLLMSLLYEQKRFIKNEEGYMTIQRMRPRPISSLREVKEQIELSPIFKSSQMWRMLQEGRKKNG
jgi:hypothetical protein